MNIVNMLITAFSTLSNAFLNGGILFGGTVRWDRLILDMCRFLCMRDLIEHTGVTDRQTKQRDLSIGERIVLKNKRDGD